MDEGREVGARGGGKWELSTPLSTPSETHRPALSH